MHLQYVASHSSFIQTVEALETHSPAVATEMPQFGGNSAIIRTGRTRATTFPELRQIGSSGPVRFDYIVRRHRCQRASSYWQWSVLWPSLPPATTVAKKNLSCSTRNPFRSNRSTPASTNNTVAGPAIGSAPQPLAGPVSGGRAC